MNPAPRRPSVSFLRPTVPFLIAAAIALLAIVASAAPAFHDGVADPNDTRGRLDVRRVRLAHRGGTEVTVITFASWSPSAIWDRGNLYVFLDTSGGPDAEYFVLVRSTGSDLQASLWRERAGRDRFLRNVKVRRKTSNGASVRVPLKSLQFGGFRTSYFWWTTTTFTSDRCRRTCVDRAPDEGAQEQWRPGMSPTPTPSPSPSPSNG